MLKRQTNTQLIYCKSMNYNLFSKHYLDLWIHFLTKRASSIKTTSSTLSATMILNGRRYSLSRMNICSTSSRLRTQRMLANGWLGRVSFRRSRTSSWPSARTSPSWATNTTLKLMIASLFGGGASLVMYIYWDSYLEAICMLPVLFDHPRCTPWTVVWGIESGETKRITVKIVYEDEMRETVLWG